MVGLAGTSSQADAKSLKPLCEGRGIKVDVRFARAGANACSIKRVDGQVEIRLDIRPETNPVNPSPWYAFKLISKREQPVMVRLNYGTFRHRYRPHVKTEASEWSGLAAQDVRTTANGSEATFALTLEAGSTLVAGQPFDPPAMITQDLDRTVSRGDLERTVFGRSVAGIPLLAYHSMPIAAEGTVIVLTRQHPPEVAGEWAFDAFVAALLGSTEQAGAFRARYGLVIMPLLNPDGVASGFWRSNHGLVDLNRDWGPFTQPETKAASAFILSKVAKAPAIALLDFHATGRDVIYAQPQTPSLYPPSFIDGWLTMWTNALGRDAPRIDRSHNASNANSKTWGRLALGVAAITYEVGDETPRPEAEARARLAAELFMQHALSLPATNKAPRALATGTTP
jgi:cytosolic carboxypeptidase protein 6